MTGLTLFKSEISNPLLLRRVRHALETGSDGRLAVVGAEAVGVAGVAVVEPASVVVPVVVAGVVVPVVGVVVVAAAAASSFLATLAASSSSRFSRQR